MGSRFGRHTRAGRAAVWAGLHSRAVRILVAAACLPVLVAGSPGPAAGGALFLTRWPGTTAAAGTHFVALGDSLTAGYLNPGPAWPARLVSLRDDLTLVRNSGVSGDTTTNMLARIDRDVYAYSPSLVFIFGGLNDLAWCVPIDQIVANIKAMAAGAYGHGAGRVVLILNSHSIDNPRGPSCVPTVQANIDALDDALLAYGAAAGIQTIDLRPVLDTSGRYTPAYFLSDGVHYNSDGVDRVSAAIDAQLSAGFDRYLRGDR